MQKIASTHHRPAAVLVLLIAGLLIVASIRTPALQAQDKSAAEIDRSRRDETVKNIRKIGVAMHYYHGDNGALPPAGLGLADKPPHLSWRVLILPFLDQKALFDQFQLNEPWDSEHNKKLIAKMPAIYAPVGIETKEKHTTYYQVVVGPDTPFDPKQQVTLGKLVVNDGASNTFMIVEGGDPVVWTKPADVTWDPDKGIPKLGGAFKDGFHACFADCSIRFVKREITEPLFRQLAGFKDGLNGDPSEYLVPVGDQ